MPIAQERVLALLSAAQDYQQALSTILEAIGQQKLDVESGLRSAEEALMLLQVTGNGNMLLAKPQQSPVTIAIEATHFRAHKQDNLRRRDRARRKRAGVPPATVTSIKQITLDSKSAYRQLEELELGTGAPAVEFDEGSVYVPGELDEETKRMIERELTGLTDDKGE